MTRGPINVLVIFQSRSGRTEALALAAAVGAVQARANIRIRQLPSSGEESTEQSETMVRMRREYVPPMPADTKWADAVIVAMNGQISGIEIDLEAATAYGRQIVRDLRALLVE